MSRHLDDIARTLAGLTAVVFVVVVAGRFVNGHGSTADRLDAPLGLLWAATIIEVVAVPVLLAAMRRGASLARLTGGVLTVVVMAGAVLTQSRLDPPAIGSLALASTLLCAGVLLIAATATTNTDQ